MPHLKGDPGIFIAKVRERGAAADDGRINEGDKIIEVLHLTLTIISFHNEILTFKFDIMKP